MLPLLTKLPPAIVALILQFFSFLVTLLFLLITRLHLEPISFAILCGLIAAIASHLAGLARWWLPIQMSFVPGLVLMLQAPIPPWFFLAAFALFLLIYWSTFRSQVPFYLSSKKVWITLGELLPKEEIGKQFSFMDIGCGTGGGLIHLAKFRQDGQYFGIENAPLPYFICRIRFKFFAYPNCHVIWRNLWTCDLAKYDVVFAYLSPVPMKQLWHKVKTEMRPGTLFISNTFTVPDHPSQYSITLDDLHKSTLHIWHI